VNCKSKFQSKKRGRKSGSKSCKAREMEQKQQQTGGKPPEKTGLGKPHMEKKRKESIAKRPLELYF